MEGTLIAISVVSLALTSAMSFVTWRVLSLERRREAARVAALVNLADGGSRQPADLILDKRSERREPHVDSGAQTIFAAPDRPSPSGRRIVAVAAVAAVMALAVAALLFVSRSSGSAGGNVQRAGAGVRNGSVATTGTTTTAPLELLSLRHERNGEKLTITGLVRNPENGPRLERISAVAFIFDPSGTFVASERALVDFLILSPGEESPFVVNVTAPGRIGRYRIGFRGEDGAVVGHVDHRAGV
ncbi:MAG TPA: hypothetical protein VHJ77_03440 [Vicinamibacterales bacterium]|jgi:hypothetical protein|nr:hypothetical protein [Vicinamibacterales bacterium]